MYTIHSGWLFTLFTNVIQNSSLLERKGKKPPHSLCFSLFLHIVMVPNKRSDYIHSLGMLTSSFQDPPVWQLVDDDRQTITRLQTTQRNVHNQEMSYTVFPQCTSVHLRVCLWTTYKTLLLLLDICYSVHVTASAKTLIVLIIKGMTEYVMYAYICTVSGVMY